MKKAFPVDLALLVLRLAGAGLAVAHGWGKVSALAGGQGDRFVAGVEALGFPLPGAFAWAAALAEFAGGICVALGLATRWAAGLTALTMTVAAFLRHRFHLHLLAAVGVLHPSEQQLERWGDPERALLYLLIFVAIVLAGGGRFSLDRLLRRRG